MNVKSQELSKSETKEWRLPGMFLLSALIHGLALSLVWTTDGVRFEKTRRIELIPLTNREVHEIVKLIDRGSKISLPANALNQTVKPLRSSRQAAPHRNSQSRVQSLKFLAPRTGTDELEIHLGTPTSGATRTSISRLPTVNAPPSTKLLQSAIASRTTDIESFPSSLESESDEVSASLRQEVLEKISRVIIRRTETEVQGGLDREVVQKIVEDKMPSVQECYESALQSSSNLSGRISIQWTILPTGAVSQIQFETDASAHEELNPCLLRKITFWQFPPPRGGGIVRVKYPFMFLRVKG